MYDTIRASTVTATTTAAVSHWTSANRQASFDCGDLPACEALDILLGNLVEGDKEGRAAILNGSFDLSDGF